jgi:hypothetical protein
MAVNPTGWHGSPIRPAGKTSSGYYTADGKNIRRAFLRSPLEFSRITSGFTFGSLPSGAAEVARA